MEEGDIESVPDEIEALLARDVALVREEDLPVFAKALRRAWKAAQDEKIKRKLYSQLLLVNARQDEILLRDQVRSERPHDIEMVDLNKIVAAEGEAATKRHWLRTATYTVFQTVFGGFMMVARLGLLSSMKYVLSIASLPIEIFNLIVNIAKLVSKQKPWYVITLVVLGGLAAIAILAIMDAVRWGGWSSGVFASMAAWGPFVFTAILGTFAVLNIVRSIGEGIHLYQNPEYATPGKKFALAHQIVKTAGLSVLAGLIIPFMLIFIPALAAGNPIGATIVITIIVATLATMVAMKIAKTIRENREWKQTIKELKDDETDPYKRLGIDPNILANKLTDDATVAGKNEKGLKGFLQGLKNFGRNLKVIWQNSPLSNFFAVSDKQKADLADARRINKENEDNSSAAYIKKQYITTMRNDGHLRTIDMLRKNIKECKNKAELKALKVEMSQAKKNLWNDPQAAKLMQAYNLIRKERGRKQWQDANAPKENVERAPALPRSSGRSNDVTVEQGRNPNNAAGSVFTRVSPEIARDKARDPLLGKRIK